MLFGCRLCRSCSIVTWHLSISNFFIRFKNRAILVYPGYGVGVDGLLEYRGVGNVTGYLGDLGIPTDEGVAVLRITFLGGFFAVIGWHGAVLDFLINFELGAVLIHPSYGVGVDGLLEYCGVGDVAGDFADLGIPTGEGVAVLCVAFLGGLVAVVGGHGAVLDFFVDLELGAVLIYPGYGVGVDGLLKYCGVGNIAGNFGDLGIPTGEGVAVLCVAFLGGLVAVVLGHGAVLDFFIDLEFCVIPVHPCYGISIYSESCIKSNVFCGHSIWNIPTAECMSGRNIIFGRCNCCSCFIFNNSISLTINGVCNGVQFRSRNNYSSVFNSIKEIDYVAAHLVICKLLY